ncbi:hypothetical protein [Tenacibaculum ovolyticum]|uniref:hypothetical protein n=1 Tax=Tenacibaculum ovolyticum TaxID=104270 RepID=UPI0003FC0EDB|nr:hypothetical protein [Tenacibaculum ovolyticum]
MRNTIKTGVIITFTILAGLIAICFHELARIIYEENFNVQKTNISWGIFVEYLLFYVYPIMVLITSFLLFAKKKWLGVIPLLLLIIYVLYIGVLNRPKRSLLLICSIVAGYVVPFFLTYVYIFKKKWR